MKASIQQFAFLCSTFILSAAGGQADDLLIADFEGPNYGDWQVTGEAFGSGPAQGTLPGQMAVSGFKGKGLVNSFFKGDASTGTATSPEFRIERPYIGFLIGGGMNAKDTCINLLVDGKVMRNATGPNDRPGGSEKLEPAGWDVSEFIGKRAVLQIVDHATGGWGHINVDQIVQTDRKPPGLVKEARREFQVKNRFLNLPIKNGAPNRKVELVVDGRVEVQNDIGLADSVPDWWTFMDVSAWNGKTITLQVDRLSEESTALSSIAQSDSVQSAGNLYREPLRGQFHYSSRRGWNNDPNGLVYFKGEYHLFYQHNPYGWGWGNMHWGHAVSRDLLHWQELGDVLAPDALGPMFSGSAVVDWQNTSGLGKPGQPPLVLIYTAAGNPTVQCIASSTDGRHFTKYSGNPVLQQITGGNRDPKVFWHESSQRWVMTLYVETNKIHTVHFFNSPDLKQWTLLSRTDGFFECPDFFELPVDGNTANHKWVLTAANSEYMLGSFDGKTFTPETTKLPGHRGKGFYAAQTFSDIPASDGRRIQIGWFQTETKGMPFNQSMTVPLELRLTTTTEGTRLTMNAVRELTTLRLGAQHVGPLALKPGDVNPLAGASGDLFELRADFEPGAASVVEFSVRGIPVSFDAAKQELDVQGHRAPAPLRAGRQRLIIYCDRTGLEIFAGDGLTYVPWPVNLDANHRGLDVAVHGDLTKFTSLDVHRLSSIWP